MSKYQFDYLVFIGRFQPFHNGHLKVIEEALQLAATVIIVMGSADSPRTPKNPFTARERSMMIMESTLPLTKNSSDYFPITSPNRLRIAKVRDSMYNNQKWAVDVQQAVSQHMLTDGWQDQPRRIGIIGHHKDETSFYLDMFPQWPLVEHTLDEVLSATDLRTLYFDRMNLKFLMSLIPPQVNTFLGKFIERPEYAQLVAEHEFIKKYKEQWKAAPYAPTFATVDAVVVQSAHVLMVQRKHTPGQGLWALPGGFINQTEWLDDAAIRELREETKLKIPPAVLKGSIKNTHVFDHPNRSQRGRTITHAFHIELPAGPLPKVKGSDDAMAAAWLPINEVYNKWDQLFEDHGHIISYFVGV